MKDPKDLKAGYVGLIGVPNAGKSTLLNALVGEKVSIVTAKPQTTRQRVVGVYTDEQTQILFVDTPGKVPPKGGLCQFLHDELTSVMKDVDVLVAILNLDARQPQVLEEILKEVAAQKKPWCAVITKADVAPPHRRHTVENMVRAYGVPRVVGSAKNQAQELISRLLPVLRGLLPPSEGYLYDPELYTTQNLRELAAEVIREKCFLTYHHEVPFGLAVKISKFEEGRHRRVFAEILVNKPSHKSIVIGKGGEKLKQVGTAARLELEKIIGGPVFLDLHVKVKHQWADDKALMQELGYVVRESSARN